MSDEPAQLQPGTVVAGRYRVEGTLGQGGMAIVYRARHLGTDKECALKLLFPELADDAKLRELFLQEARVSGRIGACPYIVDVFDTGIDGQLNTPFIAMELLHGATLAKRLRYRTIAREEVEPILLQLGKGLEAAHRAGVVHRDLKPGNIFLTEGEEGQLRVKILDFGIAKVLEGPGGRTATQAGSPWYSAPEQLGASMRKLAAKQGFNIVVGVTPATDVWALALCACELVLGLRANRYWDADTSADLMIRIALEPRRPPSERLGVGARVVPGFDEWFLRCTAHDATARYQSALEAVQALVALLRDPAQPAQLAGPLPPVTMRMPAAAPSIEADPGAAPVQPVRGAPTVRIGGEAGSRAVRQEPSAVAPLQGAAAPTTAGPAAVAGSGPLSGTHVSQIVRQGSSQPLAGQGAMQAVSAVERLRSGSGASRVPTDDDGFPTTPALGASAHSSPSGLGFSDAGVRAEPSMPAGAQTSSSWQNSAVRIDSRKRLAVLLGLGGGLGTLMLVVALVWMSGGPAAGKDDEGATARETAGASSPPSGVAVAQSADSAGDSSDRGTEGQGASASSSPASSAATESSSAPSAAADGTGGPSSSASADAGSAAKARAGRPRPEGKEQVFEDF